ncbi:MAG: hypothetical protein U5Q03_13620 [Bacteroidota bacterium]|nr:hypothetical protein [Bacteroidota bacterium]
MEGLTNGSIVYKYLEKNKFVDLSLVITYPDNTHKPRFVTFPDNDNVIKTDSANKYIEKVKQINPDLIFVAGWSELLSHESSSYTK